MPAGRARSGRSPSALRTSAASCPESLAISPGPQATEIVRRRPGPSRPRVLDLISSGSGDPLLGGCGAGGRGRGGAEGEAEGEAGPLAEPALGAEAAVVRLDDIAAD